MPGPFSVIWWRDADLEPERADFNVAWRGTYRRAGFDKAHMIDALA